MLFLVCLCRCFWMKLAFESVDSVKQFTRWVSCSPPTLLIEGRKNPALPTFFGLLELGHPPSALGAPCSQTIGLKPNYITAFLGRRLADGRSCNLCDPIPYNKSFLVCVYVYVHVTKTNTDLWRWVWLGRWVNVYSYRWVQQWIKHLWSCPQGVYVTIEGNRQKWPKSII